MTTLAFILLLAQVGYPGGQYPGQYPPGQGGGIPFPGRSKKTTTDKSGKQADTAPTVFVRGNVSQLDEKTVEVKAEDSRFITFTITDKTVKPSGLAQGDSVEVSAREDGKGGFTADSIKLTEKKIVDADAGPSATVLKGPKYDEGDSGPPQLTRGKPAATSRPSMMRDAPVPVADAPPAPVMNPRQAFIERAKEEAKGFLTGLPNYVCQEYTTRYQSEGKVNDWHALDIVSVEVVYEGGKERYQNVAINGKPSKRPVEESGAWSTGEFGTVLEDLFSPATAAQFKFIKDSSVAGSPASIYDFSVDRNHSHWKVTISAQSIYPSYKGSVWIDKKTARVVRIEMQATQIPPDFPEDSVESAVDYGYVSLGADKFFLPLQAEVLSCHRGVNVCDRNKIEFRNYHKFTGDSKILFNQ